MFLLVKELLKGRELRQLLDLSTKISFVDGRATNPESTIKNNLQAEFGTELSKEVSSIVGLTAYRSQEFLNFAFPKILAPPLASPRFTKVSAYVFSAATDLPLLILRCFDAASLTGKSLAGRALGCQIRGPDRLLLSESLAALRQKANNESRCPGQFSFRHSNSPNQLPSRNLHIVSL